MQKLTQDAFAALGAGSLCYVKPEKMSDLGAIANEVMVVLPPDTTIWSIYNADGSRLAVLTDRESAIATAHAHQFHPMAVH